MSTLNGGFIHPTDSTKHITPEDRKLIDDFIAAKGVEVCTPAGAQGSEITAITHERIMLKRREFRQKKRDEAKAAKEAQAASKS